MRRVFRIAGGATLPRSFRASPPARTPGVTYRIRLDECFTERGATTTVQLLQDLELADTQLSAEVLAGIGDIHADINNPAA